MKNRLFANLLIIATLILVSPAKGETLKEIMKNAKHPYLVKTENLKNSIIINNLTIYASKGSTYVLMAKNTPIGAVFENVEFEYTYDDPYFLPLAARNFKNAVKGKFKTANGKLSVKEHAKYIVVWSYELGKSLFDNKTGDREDLPEKILKISNNLTFGNPAYTLLFQKLFPDEKSHTVLIVTKKDKFLYVSNPVYLKSENLYAIYSYPFKHKNLRGKYYLVPLTKKTFKKHWFEKDENPYTKTVYTKLSLTNDRGEHVFLTSEQKVKILRNNTECYIVNLLSTIYRQKKISNYNVVSVQVDGQKADFAHESNFLFVKFNRKYKKGETVNITVKTEGDIAILKNGNQKWYLGIWAWYPKPKLNDERSVFEITVKTRKPFIPFASGNIIKRSESKDYNILETKLDIPSQFPVIAAGKYVTCSFEQNGYKCTAACYINKKEAAANRIADIYFKSLSFYSAIFKQPYPFKTETMVEGVSKGQAPPSLIFFSPRVASIDIGDGDRLLSAKRSPLFSSSGKPVVLKTSNFQAFVHEVAHGYWGHTVKIPNKEELWISEALCQFSSLLCITAIEPDRKEALKYYNYTMKKWKNQLKNINKGAILFFTDSFSNKSRQDILDRKRLLYVKGPLIFFALKQKLEKDFGKNKGSALFTVFLRTLLKKYKYQNLYTADLIAVLNKLTGQNWQKWFEKYVLTESLPEI